MSAAPIPTPVHDPDRLRALAAYGILDTVPEQGFDDIVTLARNACAAPVALVSLVDRDRQWFKARVGFEPCETDLNSSVCAHVLAEPDLLVIPDLTADPRTAANPLVTGEPHLRFYAGAPLRTAEGHVLGSLCVIDGFPRPDGLTPVQAESLRALARQVMTLMDLRRTAIERDAYADAQRAITDAGGDLDAILDALVAGAMRAVPAAEGGALELIDGTDLEYRAVTGTLAPHRGLRVPLNGSTSGTCATGGTAILVTDASTYPLVRRDIARLIGQRASIHVPVRRTGQVVGVLKLQSSRAAAFGEHDLRVAGMFADIATAGLTAADEARAQRAVQEGQERYRLAARATTDAIWDWDLATNHVLWNEALAAAYGHAPEAVEPTGDWRIAHIHPDDRTRIDASIHAVIDGTGTAWSDEYRFLRADGGYADVLDRGYVLRDGAGRATRMIGAMLDLTERKRAEAILREGERRLELERSLLRAVFDQAPVGISVAGASPDVPTLINVRAEAMLGHGIGEPGEERYRHYGALHANDTPYALGEYPTVRALRHGEVVRDEPMRYRNARTGEVRLLEVSSGPVRDADGAIRAAATVLADVTEQRRRDAALQATKEGLAQAQEQLRLAIESTGIGVFDYDPVNDDLGWDTRARALFGMAPGDPLTYAIFRAAVHPDDRGRVDAAIEAALDPAGDGTYDITYRAIGMNDGVERWVNGKGQALFRDGRTVRFIGTIRDVSAVRLAETQQDLVNRELSHRMKNLLAMVQSIASQTMRGAADLDTARDVLAGRLIALGRAHDLLLGGTLASTRMDAVVRGAVQVHQDRPDRFTIDGPDLEIGADQALALALSTHELATNATKYGALTTEAGRVAIDWQVVESEAEPVLRLSWVETGGPPVRPPTRKGFGSRFLERALAAQIGGEMVLAYSETGLAFTLTAPLSAFTATR